MRAAPAGVVLAGRDPCAAFSACCRSAAPSAGCPQARRGLQHQRPRVPPCHSRVRRQRPLQAGAACPRAATATVAAHSRVRHGSISALPTLPPTPQRHALGWFLNGHWLSAWGRRRKHYQCPGGASISHQCVLQQEQHSGCGGALQVALMLPPGAAGRLTTAVCRTARLAPIARLAPAARRRLADQRAATASQHKLSGLQGQQRHHG